MFYHQLPITRRNVPFRRAMLSLLAVAVLLLLSTTAVFAQDVSPGTSTAPVDEPVEPAAVLILPVPTDPVPLDPLCITGMVIDHAENPVAGWTVTATYEGVNGSYAPMTAVSDEYGEFRFELPGPGRWAVEIESRERFEGVTATRMAVHVGFGNVDCVDVRFKVRELVEVIVIKIDDEHTPQPGWIITATPGPGNTFGKVQTQVTDENGRAVFSLTPGAWIFTEAPPLGVRWWRPISPPLGVHRLVVVGPGPYTIRFKNQIEKEPNTCINVFKFDVPSDPSQENVGLAGWIMEVVQADGTIAASGETNSFGYVGFSGLEYGPYTVREIMQPGWFATSPTSYAVVLTSSDDGCTDIYFYNKQLPKGFCFTGRKLDENGMVGIPDWQIMAVPTEAGDPAPDAVLTDGEGRYLICLPLEDYRIPGSVYRLTEVIPDGWEAVSPIEYTATLPMQPDVPVVVPNFVNRQSQFAADDPVMMVMVTTATAHTTSCSSCGECSTVHVVQPGESVYKLADMYDVSAMSIFSANPWIASQRNRWLYTGQEVCIP